MKQVYLIMCFDKQTRKYLSTLNAAFTSKNAANLYIEGAAATCIYVVRPVDLHCSKDFA